MCWVYVGQVEIDRFRFSSTSLGFTIIINMDRIYALARTDTEQMELISSRGSSLQLQGVQFQVSVVSGREQDDEGTEEVMVLCLGHVGERNPIWDEYLPVIIIIIINRTVGIVSALATRKMMMKTTNEGSTPPCPRKRKTISLLTEDDKAASTREEGKTRCVGVWRVRRRGVV